MANNKALLWAIGICVSIATWGVSSAETSAETLKIGVIAPLTGGGAPWEIAGDQAYQDCGGGYQRERRIGRRRQEVSDRGDLLRRPVQDPATR